jgi:hypothetical protein
MNYRSFLRKSILIITGFFWASCGEDDAQPITINEPAPESSSALESSSSENSLLQLSSSNGTSESSSSAPTGDVSSSSGEQFKLASDTSVTCTSKQTSYSECVNTAGSSGETCYSIESDLRINTTLTIEELIKIEDRLENCVEAVTVYGVSPCMPRAITFTEYNCSNGKTYTYLKDGLVYTNAEYDSLFNSSSSEASSSSTAPAPLCQKSDFIYKHDAVEDISKEKLDSLATAGETVSDSLKKCVRRSFPYEEGKYAKTQICDGDTTVNPRYQAKLDSIREEIDKTINLCKAPDVPADSTKTPADSTGTPADTTNTPAE